MRLSILPVNYAPGPPSEARRPFALNFAALQYASKKARPQGRDFSNKRKWDGIDFFNGNGFLMRLVTLPVNYTHLPTSEARRPFALNFTAF